MMTMSPNMIAVAANTGTIVSDVGASFLPTSTTSTLLTVGLSIITLSTVVFYFALATGSAFKFVSEKKEGIVALAGFLATGFMVTSMVTAVMESERGEINPEEINPMDYAVYLGDAVEDVFSENAEFKVIEPGGEFASSARLPSESYDPDNEVYSGEVVVSDMSEVTVVKYDVTVDLDGTVTFDAQSIEDSNDSEGRD